MQEFKVQGMTCNHCVMAVKKSILQADEKAKVDVDLPSGAVKVESTLTSAQIADRIVDAGYAVTSGR